ncbi:MAG: PQQ-like beta-propeller repeat protein [Clostridia bacterium]|nr:PQQ-like beta-propeller repeat protein [Clostridia bacterium]
MPAKCFIEAYNEKIIIYTGKLWLLHEDSLTELFDQPIEEEINSYFLYQNRLIFADRSNLRCINVETNCVEWQLHIPNTKNYSVGDITLFENSVACYGNDQLLFVNISTGSIVEQIKIPRVDKLFNPIRMQDGSLLIGYTNWSNAGILRYDNKAKKVIWKSSRAFQGPLLRRKIYLRDNRAYWVKNDTELVCIHAENGNEIYRTQTSPWLYTDLLFLGDRIYYGTAGRDGFLMCLHAESGDQSWAFPLKNGCAYFDVYSDCAIVGDFDKKIYQFDLSTGRVQEQMQVDGEVVGRIRTDQNQAYTVVWGSADRPIRLIKFKIQGQE